jgi:hypothetical protein
MPLILALALLTPGGYGGNKKEAKEGENAIEAVEVIDYLEPDNYFQKAIVHFENGNKEAAVDMISSAAEFIESVVVEGDTLHANIIEFALGELDDLTEEIQNGNVSSPEQLRMVFASVDQSIGIYHMTVIESWVINETNDERSLRRMHRALTRTGYALDHSGLILAELEEEELAKAKEDVLKADKASHDLWKRVKAKIKV